MFPDYLSVSYDYDEKNVKRINQGIKAKKPLNKLRWLLQDPISLNQYREKITINTTTKEKVLNMVRKPLRKYCINKLELQKTRTS